MLRRFTTELLLNAHIANLRLVAELSEDAFGSGDEISWSGFCGILVSFVMFFFLQELEVCPVALHK